MEYQLLVVNLLTIADSCFMSWSRANDGWFPRLFPDLAARFGAEAAAAPAVPSGGKKHQDKKATR